MFGMDNIIYDKMQYASDKYDNSVVVLKQETAIDVLTIIKIYKILKELRLNNNITSQQFRSVRGQLKHSLTTPQAKSFIQNILLQKFNIKWEVMQRDVYKRVNDNFYMYNYKTKTLWETPRNQVKTFRLW